MFIGGQRMEAKKDYEAVVFDMDGVIFDSERAVMECWKILADKYGIENIEEARELLAEAGYPNGEGFPTLTYNYPTLELDSDTAQVLKEQLKRNLNINVELKAQELQVNYSDRHAGNFELCRMNWTADFTDPYTYLSLLLTNSTYNCNGVKDAEYDALVKASDSETDPEKRSQLLHQAEQLAVGKQFYVIPLFSMKSCNLIRPEIIGITQIAATGALEYRYADRR